MKRQQHYQNNFKQTNMKNRKTWMQARFLVPIGLLMVTIPTMLGRYMNIPDLLKGLLAGVGIAMELLGLVAIRRKKSCCSDLGDSPLTPRANRDI